MWSIEMIINIWELQYVVNDMYSILHIKEVMLHIHGKHVFGQFPQAKYISIREKIGLVLWS